MIMLNTLPDSRCGVSLALRDSRENPRKRTASRRCARPSGKRTTTLHCRRPRSRTPSCGLGILSARHATSVSVSDTIVEPSDCCVRTAVAERLYAILTRRHVGTWCQYFQRWYDVVRTPPKITCACIPMHPRSIRPKTGCHQRSGEKAMVSGARQQRLALSCFFYPGAGPRSLCCHSAMTYSHILDWTRAHSCSHRTPPLDAVYTCSGSRARTSLI
ncbi:hypothetical protein C8Q79DRAFT_413646 [Trametes meyenii]|nr:hypothetical protein C8Q79DRAFT_413646 [Trametes meyenii]